MAVINFAHREITAKIVYFGPTNSGCNTNVRALHELVETGASGTLHAFGTGETAERSWYFEHTGSDPVMGFAVRFRIYSMPGAVSSEEHRREVMSNVDAVVFVVDSRSDRGPDNEAALLSLEASLSDQGLELAGLPVVLQVNHSDRDDAREESAAVFDLNPYGFPVVSAAARDQVGVIETFEHITMAARERIQLALHGENDSIQLRAVHDPDGTSDDDIIAKHLEAIRQDVEPVLPTSSTPSSATPPPNQVEVPFQPRDFAGSYPVRIVDASMEDGQVYVDVEFERMGGGSTRQLRVRLANRPTDSPAMPRPQHQVVSASPVLNVTDGLPDKVDFVMPPERRDMPPVFYGMVGITGGLVAGLALGFLFFN